MSSVKLLSYAWLSYFLAVCGVTEFYFDRRSGRIVPSRYLLCYSYVSSLILVGSYPTMLLFYFVKLIAWLHTDSVLMIFLMKTNPLLGVAATLSFRLCGHYWQRAIIRMLRELLRMEDLDLELSLSDVPAEKSFLIAVFCIRIFIAIPRVGIVFGNIFKGGQQVAYHLNAFITKLQTGGFSLLTFALICQVTYSFLRLQSSLDKLLAQPITTRSKMSRLLHLHRQYYRLLGMVNELCSMFKYLLLLYLAKLTFTVLLTSYSLVRFLLALPVLGKDQTAHFYVLAMAFLDFVEFSLLGSICYLAGQLHERTFHLLRFPHPNSVVQERSNDWLALQLNLQNTQFHICGVFRIDREFVLMFANSALLYIICVLQTDYDYM